MSSHSGINDDNKDNNTSTKAIAAIPMAGIIVAGAFLSGLSLFSGYQQPAMAQNVTGTNATTITGGGGGGGAESACTPTQTGGGGGQNTTTNATTTTGAGATNATSTTSRGGNQSTSEVRMHIEEACMAAQNGDMQGVLMNLNLALNALGGNATTTGGGTTNATTALAEVLTEGGNTTGGGDGEDE